MRNAALGFAAAAALAFGPASAENPRPRPIGILLAAGDIAKCNEADGKDEATAAVVARAVADANARNIPVRILALGDLAYDRGTDAEFSCFNDSWGPFKALMLPVPGNHEYANLPGQDASGFFNYFSQPPFPPEGAVTTAYGDRAGYYAVNFPNRRTGPWRLVGLNPYTQAPGGRSRQWQWLKRDLAANLTPCVLAFAHPFLLSSGEHGHNDGASVDPVRGSLMVAPFQILYDAGATVILQGHDHDFEQFARHNVVGRPRRYGLRSFVIGTGGGRLYQSSQTRRWPVSEAYSDSSYGVLQIELHAAHYEWRFLPAEGAAPTLPVRGDRCNRRRL